MIEKNGRINSENDFIVPPDFLMNDEHFLDEHKVCGFTRFPSLNSSWHILSLKDPSVPLNI